MVALCQPVPFKDLAHWEQLPSPLREPGQMDLQGDPNSGGIWAPDLSWDGQYYYLLVTNVTTKRAVGTTPITI